MSMISMFRGFVGFVHVRAQSRVTGMEKSAQYETYETYETLKSLTFFTYETPP